METFSDFLNKKTINEAKEYPSQYDAEFMERVREVFSGLLHGGESAEIRKMVDEMDKIRAKDWFKYFGDESPWKVERLKSGKHKVVWDDSKAKKLGLDK